MALPYSDFMKTQEQGTPGWLSEKYKQLSKSKDFKKGFGGVMLYMLLEKALATGGQLAEQGVQREGIRSQAALASPENLYYQAALPQAQAEESQARQALLSTLSGGILGPSLPQGYRVIGG